MPLEPGRKYPSGAEKKRRAKAKKLEALRAEVEALGYAVVDKAEASQGVSKPSEDDDLDGAKAFSSCGPPPVDNTLTAMDWVRKVQLTAAHLALTKPLTNALRERIKWAKDIGATIGMTHPRAALEIKVKELEAKLSATRTQIGAVKQGTGHGLDYPETSRRRRGTLGPRPVPGLVLDPPEGEGPVDPS